MKKIILLLFATLILNSCDDKNDPAKPVAEADKLPAATQTGANTIGCLLDGKAFKPGYFNNSRNCFYQYTNGGYYFTVYFGNEDSNYNVSSLGMFTRKKEIHEGETYDLLEYIDGNSSGAYSFKASSLSYTTHIHTGQLKITKLDPVNYIVSGTFWYDVEDQNGVIHQIRDGRFDMQYTN